MAMMATSARQLYHSRARARSCVETGGCAGSYLLERRAEEHGGAATALSRRPPRVLAERRAYTRAGLWSREAQNTAVLEPTYGEICQKLEMNSR